ncbi:MAG: papain-like cysteine protease family protein [Acidobacteriota bacterium]
MGFTVQRQLGDFWCWAAVASSVDGYFSPGASFRQCAIVNHVRGRGDCCEFNEACDVPDYLDAALFAIGHLRDITADVLTFDVIQQEIDKRLPVCIYFRNSNGGGHYAAISGYSHGPNGWQGITISDPIFGDSEVEYHSFVNLYRLQVGQWRGSFRLQP